MLKKANDPCVMLPHTFLRYVHLDKQKELIEPRSNTDSVSSMAVVAAATAVYNAVFQVYTNPLKLISGKR